MQKAVAGEVQVLPPSAVDGESGTKDILPGKPCIQNLEKEKVCAWRGPWSFSESSAGE